CYDLLPFLPTPGLRAIKPNERSELGLIARKPRRTGSSQTAFSPTTSRLLVLSVLYLLPACLMS
ncbi:MAG: hypothetical protein R3C05_31995, partial [Pirellulaceae bacterium]